MFVKADCEGCEGGDLLGAKTLLSKNPPCPMFIERRSTNMHDLGTSDKEMPDLVTTLISTCYDFI